MASRIGGIYMKLIDYTHLTDEQLVQAIKDAKQDVQYARENKLFQQARDAHDRLDNLLAEQFLREEDF